MLIFVCAFLALSVVFVPLALIMMNTQTDRRSYTFRQALLE